MKITTIVISQSPLKTVRVAEALRMGVGLTLCGDSVQALFLEDGVYALLHTEPQLLGMPEYLRHMNTLRQLRHHLFAERESIEERNLGRLCADVQIIARNEVTRLLLGSNCIIRY